MFPPKRHKQDSIVSRVKEIQFSTHTPHPCSNIIAQSISSPTLKRLGAAVLSSGASRTSCDELVAASLETSSESGRKKVNQATYHTEKGIKNLLQPITYFPCVSCGISRNNQYSACTVQKCDSFGLPVKRGTYFEPTWLGTYALEPQLKPVIAEYLAYIIKHHGVLHDNNRINDIIGEMSSSPRYRNSIESIEEFKAHKICLPITIGYDGFVPKGNRKIEFTPLYVRIEGIGDKANRNIKNVALSTLLVARSGLSEKNAYYFGERIEAEVTASQIFPWKFTIEGTSWDVSLKPTFLLCDMAGLRKVSLMPDWFSETDACVQCDVKGVRVNNAPRFFDASWVMRKRSVVEQQGLLKIKKRENSVTRLAPPWKKTSDELHLWSEGLAKDIIKALFTSESRWKLLRIPNKVIQELNDALDILKNYTFSRGIVSCIRYISNMSGSEIREMLRICLPIISLFGVTMGSQERLYITYLYGYIYGLYGFEEREEAPDLRNLGLLLHNLHGTLSLSTYTLKAHDLYLHAVDDVIENGLWRSQSTAEMEKYHKEFHFRSVSGSSSPQNMASRFFSTQLLRRNGQITDTDASISDEDEEDDTDANSNGRIEIRYETKLAPLSSQNIRSGSFTSSPALVRQRASIHPHTIQTSSCQYPNVVAKPQQLNLQNSQNIHPMSTPFRIPQLIGIKRLPYSHALFASSKSRPISSVSSSNRTPAAAKRFSVNQVPLRSSQSSSSRPVTSSGPLLQSSSQPMTSSGSLLPRTPSIATSSSGPLIPMKQSSNSKPKTALGAPSFLPSNSGKNMDYSKASIAVELLQEKAKGPLTSDIIDKILTKHKNEPNYEQNYAKEIMFDKIGQLGSAGNNLGTNFLLKLNEKNMAKLTSANLFNSIEGSLNINTEYQREFTKDGPLWNCGFKSTCLLESYPSDGLRCVSAIIKYLLFDLTKNAEDILYFTFNLPKQNERQFIEIPKDVCSFVIGYILESVGLPAEILKPEFSIETLRVVDNKLYKSLGVSLADQTSRFAALKHKANTLHKFIRMRASKILSDHRYQKVIREAERTTFLKKTESEKKEWKDSFDEKKKAILEILNN